MYTIINAFDPREIIVIAFTEIDLEELRATLQIDVKERLSHSLDDIIKPEIERKFGLLVSGDDFSASGPSITNHPQFTDKKPISKSSLKTCVGSQT
jgi:hypothetical protein